MLRGPVPPLLFNSSFNLIIRCPLGQKTHRWFDFCTNVSLLRRNIHVKSNPSYFVNHLNQIAHSHLSQKELQQSLAVIKKSMQICETYTLPKYYLTNEELSGMAEPHEPSRVLPSKYMLWTVVTMSEVYLEMGNIEEANKCVNKGILIAQRTYTETDERNLYLLVKIGIFYYKSGQKQLAKDTFNTVLRLSKQNYAHLAGTLKRHSCAANYYLGLMEFENKNIDKAKQLLELSLSQHRLVRGVSHPRTIAVMVSLANVYLELGIYVEARKLVEYAAEHYMSHHNYTPLPHLEELHKAIIENIPDATGLLKHLPISTRTGFKPSPFEI